MPEPVLRASEYMRTPQVDMLLLGRGEQMRERSANRRTFKTLISPVMSGSMLRSSAMILFTASENFGVPPPSDIHAVSACTPRLPR